MVLLGAISIGGFSEKVETSMRIDRFTTSVIQLYRHETTCEDSQKWPFEKEAYLQVVHYANGHGAGMVVLIALRGIQLNVADKIIDNK